MNPYRNTNLKKFIDSIPKKVIEEQNRLQDEENRRFYQEFITALKTNKCSLCNMQMDQFDIAQPCFHWFTYPVGIKKKYFNDYLQKPISFYRLDAYFRWLANAETPLGNINDLKEETSPNSYIESTIKYKNIEWAFSIGHTDLDGHINSTTGTMPHYHIQMKVNDMIFIKFNDFHLQFTDEDLFTIELLKQASDKVEVGPAYGAGMGILENEENLKLIDDYMSVAEDENTASFNRQTLIQAPEGETLSVELIQKAMKESQKTKRPLGKILQEYFKNAKATTIITPGSKMPNMAKRSGKK